MSASGAGSGDGKFGCPSCGKRYTWKPEIAGKKAKCKCGAVMSVPATVPAKAPPPPPVPARESEDDLYGFREEQEQDICPSCKREMPSAAVICVNCGFNRKTGQRLATMTGQAAPAQRAIPPVPSRAAGSPATDTFTPYPVKKKLSDETYQTVYSDAWKGYIAIAVGLGIMALGIYWMTNFDPSWFERSSRSGFRRRGSYLGIVRLLYSLVGKTGLILIVELIGLAVGYWGWGVATGRIDPDSGDD